MRPSHTAVRSHTQIVNVLLKRLTDTGLSPLSFYPEPIFLPRGSNAIDNLPMSTAIVFPHTAVISAREDFNGVPGHQLVVIGSEGFYDAGIPDALMPAQVRYTVVQPGAVSAVLIESFWKYQEFFFPILRRFQQQAINSLAVSLCCVSRHNAVQRVSRWLLSISMRSPLREVYISHEELAVLLGFRREAVSAALSQLKKIGAVSCLRSRIAVTDSFKLRMLSCECHTYDIEHLKQSHHVPRIPVTVGGASLGGKVQPDTAVFNRAATRTSDNPAHAARSARGGKSWRRDAW